MYAADLSLLLILFRVMRDEVNLLDAQGMSLYLSLSTSAFAKNVLNAQQTQGYDVLFLLPVLP